MADVTTGWRFVVRDRREPEAGDRVLDVLRDFNHDGPGHYVGVRPRPNYSPIFVTSPRGALEDAVYALATSAQALDPVVVVEILRPGESSARDIAAPDTGTELVCSRCGAVDPPATLVRGEAHHRGCPRGYFGALLAERARS